MNKITLSAGAVALALYSTSAFAQDHSQMDHSQHQHEPPAKEKPVDHSKMDHSKMDHGEENMDDDSHVMPNGGLVTVV